MHRRDVRELKRGGGWLQEECPQGSSSKKRERSFSPRWLPGMLVFVAQGLRVRALGHQSASQSSCVFQDCIQYFTQLEKERGSKEIQENRQ